MKTVIVEDNVLAAQNLAQYISAHFPNIELVHVYHDAAKALDYLRRHEIDLLLTDICMPGMDGIELIGKVHALHPQLRIVVLSAYDDFDYVRKAFLLGVKDYLLKPIDKTLLAGILNHRDAKINDEEEVYVKRIKTIVADNIDKQISLASIADSLSMNASYCSSLFKQATGENLFTYITRVRMEKAMQLLKETHLKVYEIAELCGYSESKYFISVFKKQTGMTPNEYRDS